MPRWAAAPLVVAAIALAGCGGHSTSGGAIRVVAAENVWGSVARELAGNRANVKSIITDPAQDPHSYEPTAADARALAQAQLVIANGLGYDPWSSRLLAANPVSGRIVGDVGALLHLRDGDNPHRWYDPGNVQTVADAISSDLSRLDPGHAAYYAARRRSFETNALAQYHQLIEAIRRRYGGTAVGASESIFAPLAPALGLRLLTPYTFLNAISEGTEPTARDTVTTERQIVAHEIKVWVFNSQNETPAVQHLNALAKANAIPVVTITETLTPSSASFQQWQDNQLARLESALREATGR